MADLRVITVRMPRELHERLKRAVHVLGPSGLSMNGVCVDVIANFVNDVLATSEPPQVEPAAPAASDLSN